MYAICFDNVPRKSMSMDSQLKAEPHSPNLYYLKENGQMRFLVVSVHLATFSDKRCMKGRR
jgi:hypothetical protein